jgi:hypothetical protein
MRPVTLITGNCYCCGTTKGRPELSITVLNMKINEKRKTFCYGTTHSIHQDRLSPAEPRIHRNNIGYHCRKSSKRKMNITWLL